MATVTLEIPDELMVKLKKQSSDVGHELRLAAAFSLCSAGDLSTSQAAHLAGMTYGEFLEAAARAKVMLYSVNIEELKEEIPAKKAGGSGRLIVRIAVAALVLLSCAVVGNGSYYFFFRGVTASDIVGRWEFGDPDDKLILEFHADGTGTIDRIPITFKLEGDQLTIKPANAIGLDWKSLDIVARLEIMRVVQRTGNQLRMEVFLERGPGQVIVLKKTG